MQRLVASGDDRAYLSPPCMNRRTFHSLSLGASLSLLRSPSLAAAAEKIRIGQIGTQHAHGLAQLDELRKCPDFEVVGIVEPDEAHRKAAASKPMCAGLPWLTEEQLLNTPGLQAVAVETEVASLLEHAQRVADAGLHLHLDKPAGQSLPAFRKVVETLGAHRRLLKMGYMFRFNSGFTLLFQAAQEGWLGEIFSVDAVMSKALKDAERQSYLPYPGGSMFELGCHIIDAALLLMGKPDRVTPYSRETRSEPLKDNMLAVLEYPKATVTIRSSFVEIDGGARRQFVACGTKGTCDIQPLEAPAVRLALDAPHGTYHKGYQKVDVANLPRFAADWKAFAAAIRGEAAWPYTPEHDLAVQETVLHASGCALD